MSETKMLTVQEAAELVGVRPRAIYNWIKAGLPALNFGERSTRIREDELMAWARRPRSERAGVGQS